MKLKRWARLSVIILLALVFVAAVVVISQLPSLAAGGLLHPWRRPVSQPPPPGCEDKTFPGMGVALAGWQCHAPGEQRGTLVYLHGVADNRAAVAGIVSRFMAQGFDVVAYDSRSHGNSQGDICTYGFYEKEDLRSVLAHARPRAHRADRHVIGCCGRSAGSGRRQQGISSRGRRGIFRSSYRRQGARPLFLTEEVIRKAISLLHGRQDTKRFGRRSLPKPRRFNTWRQDGVPLVSKVRDTGNVKVSVSRSLDLIGGVGRLPEGDTIMVKPNFNSPVRRQVRRHEFP